MPKFVVQLNLFSAHHVALMCEGLVVCNEDDLRRNRQLPRLYESGVRYVREKPGENQWKGILETYADKAADCEDLACARCAELRVRDGERGARVTVKFVREGLWHVRVRRASGQIEDPSRVLGMGR